MATSIDMQQQFIDIRCLRITYPKSNLQFTPLNGLYEPIMTESESMLQQGEFPIVKKFGNFSQLPCNLPNVDNLFALSSGFGKILLQETLKALIIIVNRSKDELDLTLTNLKIKITSEPISKDVPPKQTENQIVIKEDVILKPGHFYSIRINQLLENMAKYTIEISTIIQIKIKEQQYAKDSYGRQIKNSYMYVDKLVKKDFLKKLTFETVLPFKIKESFSYVQMQQCQIEVNVTNPSIMPLNIFDIYLQTDKFSSEKIYPVDTENIKNFILQPNEELNLLFMIDNREIYLNTPNFYINIDWSNAFDSNTKHFIQMIHNNLNIYNDTYKLILVDAPKSQIYLGQNFKVIFEVQNRGDKNLKLEIGIGKENIKNEREVDVIDVVDNVLELKDKATFCLICKSEIIGTVCLPRIKIFNPLLNKQDFLEKLLFFNCVKEVQLI